MAQCRPDAMLDNLILNPKDNLNLSEPLAEAASVKSRPADLALIRSLSKSDSDLLASPAGEEDEGLAGRSGSVSNCDSGQLSMKRMPSFASEWDEVIVLLWGGGKGHREWHCRCECIDTICFFCTI